jgi:predicted dehydrogenase
MRHGVIIIGAGRISSGFDAPGDLDYLTHCHVLKDHPSFEILGMYDSDPNTLSLACKKWGVTPLETLDQAIHSGADIVLVSTPDSAHPDSLRRILSSSIKPKLVICEKPLTVDILESKNIVDQYELSHISLEVGYQRRYDIDINLMIKKVKDGSLGKFIAGAMIYSKGILHNGSHGVDLLRYIFGDVMGAEVFSGRVDWSEYDPTVDGLLRFQSGIVHLIAGDERAHSLFEIDLIFSNSRYQLKDSGINLTISCVKEDPIFAGYKILMPNECRPSTLNHSLYSMWDHYAKALNGTEKFLSSGKNALKTQEICTQLISSIPSSLLVK